MKSNLSRWGLSRYYITKEGMLYFKTLNKGWVKKPFRLLESKKRKKYTQSLLNDEGKYVYEYLHRLVAEAYIPNPNNLPVVMHKDDSPKNNHVSNLKWGTHKDNTWDSIIKGRNSYPPYGKGLNHPGSLLAYKPRLQRRIIRLYNKGLSYKAIGLRVNLGPKVISRFVSIRNSLK